MFYLHVGHYFYITNDISWWYIIIIMRENKYSADLDASLWLRDKTHILDT